MAPEPSAIVIDAEYLTGALSRSGAFDTARVSDVSVMSSRATVLSRIERLRVIYEAPAPNAPATLIHKTGLPERLGNEMWDAGRQEVAFYTTVAPHVRERLVPTCFDAAWNPETRAWHLLLEDLTDTHLIATAWPLPPTMQQCQRMVEARARFAAIWWDEPRLGVSVGSLLDAAAIERNLQRLAVALATFSDREGDRLPRARREFYERLLVCGPRLHQRVLSRRNLTILQGDAHFWNCFLPVDGEGDVRLFDWDCWRVDVATDDLAYMIAMHWYPDRRRQMERQLLDRFHAALIENGVQGYDRQALDDDYRLSVLWQATTPIWQANAKIPPVIWWNNLERILLAIEDLGCSEFLR
jgi:hypothetical protein